LIGRGADAQTRLREPMPSPARPFRALVVALLAALVGSAGAGREAHAQPPVDVDVDGTASRDPWLGRDKALHFGASAGLALAGYGGTALLTADQGHRLGVGASLALGAGIGKEIADRYTGGDPSLRDLAWDVVGTASGLVLAWLLDRYVF
jgi:uncharacterized protein YfiM (DUF2279 family)